MDVAPVAVTTDADPVVRADDLVDLVDPVADLVDLAADLVDPVVVGRVTDAIASSPTCSRT